MGHDKLRKFAENETFSCLIQPDSRELLAQGYSVLRDHPVKGRWFGGDGRDLVLELGCGKGEYTIALAERNPLCNYVGVDIKGARLWKGAKYATEHGMPNVAFLRTRIEFITSFFAPSEVSRIWLTFSDPQLKKENSRLTSPLFIERYRKFLRPGGTVHLKTDSRFLYEYTLALCRANGFDVLSGTVDLYGPDPVEGEPPGPEVYEVQTFYEKNFLSQGLRICYLSFKIDGDGPVASPVGFDAGYWRAVEGPRRAISHGGGGPAR